MLLQVLTGSLTFKSSTPLDLSRCTKSELREYFENSYNLNESIFTALKDETVFYMCPDRLRLPLIFYYCHTAIVYVNKLILAGLLKERINFEFEKMFETGVDEMSWDDTENYRMGGAYQWPGLHEIIAYRREVRQVILKIIETTPLELPITMDSKWWALLMGMEHERIHLETSSVLIRQLPIAMVSKPDGWTYAPYNMEKKTFENKLIPVEATNVTYGKDNDFPSYGWDNEYGTVSCHAPSFEASEYLVTNQEFYDFVKDGGYTKRELWSEEGWQWRTYKEARHPMFWICNKGCKSGCGAKLAFYTHCRSHDNELTSNQDVDMNTEFRYRAMFDVLEMPWLWPVDVNYHEAKAFCMWKGSNFRLLLEAEHNVIRGYQAPVENGVSCDQIFNKERCHNNNLLFGSSTPVNMFAANNMGFFDVFGNVWQWTEDHFNGLCSDTHWLYDDFSTPCYDGKHNIILGGSWISTGDEASRYARFAFRRHFLQHAGFRLARTCVPPHENVQIPNRIIDTTVYVHKESVADVNLEKPETMTKLDQSTVSCTPMPSTNLQFHFESTAALKGILELEFGYRKPFPVVVADFCINLVRNNSVDKQNAFWIGAGIGRGPLILSQAFEKVLGIDVVARFMDTAKRFQRGANITFHKKDGHAITCSADSNSKPQNVTFKQFTWIPNEVGIFSYDITIVTFLERTQNPKAWLCRLAEITKVGGLVVIASPTGLWTKDKLEPFLNSKSLSCVEAKELPYDCSNGHMNSQLTIWKHI